MEKIDRTEIDCEGAETGYRCWAAGEPGFVRAVADEISPELEKLRKAFGDIVEEKLQHIIDIETKTHGKHHEYIQSQIDRNRRDEERWEKVKTQVLGWGVIAIAGWIGKLVLDAISHYRGQP